MTPSPLPSTFRGVLARPSSEPCEPAARSGPAGAVLPTPRAEVPDTPVPSNYVISLLLCLPTNMRAVVASATSGDSNSELSQEDLG